MGRKEDLLDQVVDHVLEHGLIGLTLRPLAAAIGTSDRMLIYHFGSRDELVTAVVTTTVERTAATLRTLPAADGIEAAVLALWSAYQEPPLSACLQLYVQAAATGLIGVEPYRSTVRASNDVWSAGLKDYFRRCGAREERLGRIVTLVDSSLFGFVLDLTTDRPDELATGVADLASAVAGLAG